MEVGLSARTGEGTEKKAGWRQRASGTKHRSRPAGRTLLQPLVKPEQSWDLHERLEETLKALGKGCLSGSLSTWPASRRKLLQRRPPAPK